MTTPFRMKWKGSYQHTTAATRHGLTLAVKFLRGSRSWGVYVDGRLREKIAVAPSKPGEVDSREQAKRCAVRWGDFRPNDLVPCSHCNGTGRVRRPATPAIVTGGDF